MRLSANRNRGGVVYFAAVVGIIAALALFGTISLAQTSPDAPEFGGAIKVTVTNLVAPVKVTDHDGNIVDGLQPSQFHLYDNGREQNVHVDPSYEPVSLVVAIEKSARVESVLPQIRKLGTLLTQITGKQGETAVLAFDCRLQMPQDFTQDDDKIKVAINNIQAGCSGTRIIDAVERGISMLEKRPKTNRRVLLLVSETRDEGSQARLKETLINATLSNVQIHAVDITQLAVLTTEKRPEPRPGAIPPEARSFPMGIPSTPTSSEQMYGMGNRVQVIPLLKEIFIDTKGIFVKDPATQFVRATGGEQYIFLRQKGLEEAVQRISQDIHSQYMASYKPDNADEGGYHTITVTVDRSPQYTCKTRPGYWIGGGAQ